MKKLRTHRPTAPPSLLTVKVGDKVWVDRLDRFTGAVEGTNLVTITGIDHKGRLFMCRQDALDEIMANWRYGFNPLTGEAHRYTFTKMRYATPAEVAAEETRLAAEKDAEEAAERDRKALILKEKAAPELYAALKEMRDTFWPSHNESEELFDQVQRAIAKAEGRL